MSEWVDVRLRDLCLSVDYGLTASAVADAVGPRFLRITDIVNGSFSWGRVPFVEASAEQAEKYRLHPGDIVIARTGATTGASKWLQDAPDAVFASYLVRLKVSRAVDSRFVGYLLKSSQFKDYVQAVIGDKSAQPNASAATLVNAPLRIPAANATQRGIACVLGALDDKIAINERIATAADRLANTFFRRAFSRALDHIETGAPLPSEWAVSTMGETTTVVETGKRPKGGVAQYRSGIPSIGAESIVGLGRFDFAKTKFVPRDFFAAMRRGVLEDRDILVYKDGGKPGDFKPHVTLFGNGFPFSEMCINEHVYRVRMRPEIGQEFGYYWLCSTPVMAEMRRRGTGAAIPGMNSTAFKGIPSVVPPQEEVAAFKELTAPLIDRILTAAAESRSLATLRDTLLPQLMSGRLRVKDAEKIVEDAT
ncbi:restriction endonuclease subunit S [Streptomyces sp. NPDC057596]|uniref:restriction endonuclease subunit S n=1 Tax=Streptomyces sp. NPDC057596 TaxID=3346178 RepID=UPI0036CA231F